MPDHDKKARERAIVDLVYGSRRPFAIDDSERPDFLVRLTPDDEPFGLEVAEFFQSESQARLDRIPGYVGNLLDGGPFRHKDDRLQLVIDKVSIISDAREVKNADVPAIIQQVPNLTACAEMLAEIIRVKNEKLGPAFSELRHINLIICDCTDLLGHLEPSNFYRLYCTADLRRALFSSRFREVHFVTQFSSGRVFIPLKMVVTLAQLYFLNAVVQVPELLTQLNSVDHFMRWFGSYLSVTTTGEVRIRRDSSGTEVLYGDTGFLVDAGLGVKLRSYFDARFPDSEVLAASLVGIDPTVLDRVRKFQDDNTFETCIAFPTGRRLS